MYCIEPGKKSIGSFLGIGEKSGSPMRVGGCCQDLWIVQGGLCSGIDWESSCGFLGATGKTRALQIEEQIKALLMWPVPRG